MDMVKLLDGFKSHVDTMTDNDIKKSIANAAKDCEDSGYLSAEDEHNYAEALQRIYHLTGINVFDHIDNTTCRK